MAKIFASIPVGLVSLDLRWNNIEHKSGRELATIINALPETVTSIAYDESGFLPRTIINDRITKLKLNNFLNLPGKLAQLINRTSPDATTLNWWSSQLYKYSVADLIQAFALVPQTVTEFNLSNNCLGKKSITELVKILAAIPKRVTTLNLSQNELDIKSSDNLANLLTTIPPWITVLDLSENNLSRKSWEELTKAFSHISIGIKKLNLAGNGLGWKSGDELVKILAPLPPWVTTLDLRSNHLKRKSNIELKKIFDAMPETVTSVAYDESGFISRAALNKQMSTSNINYFFYLKCLSNITKYVCLSVLIVKLFLLSPVITCIGGSLIATGTAGFYAHRLYKKLPMIPIEPDHLPGPLRMTI